MSSKQKIVKIAFIYVISTSFLLTGCIYPAPDFSAYTGVNLIPGKQFTTTIATPSPDLGWTTDEAAANYATATDMWYEPVSTTAGVNDSADSYAGYANDIPLRFGLPLLPDASVAPVFRLETKNLFINGDFEGGNLAGDTLDTANIAATKRARVDSSTPIAITLGASYFQRGSWMQLDFVGTTDNVGIHMETNVAAHTDSLSRSYALSFRFVLFSDPTKYLALDNLARDSANAFGISIINKPANQPYRFPFSVFYDIGGQPQNENAVITTTSNDLQYLVLNPQRTIVNFNNGSITAAQMKGSIDDIQLVRSALPNALRINVPLTDPSRPVLQKGGTYTVKLWVRKDKTSNYSGTPQATPNRFDADFLSISLHPYTSTTSVIGAVVVNSRDMNNASLGPRATLEGWTNNANWDEWTPISASFTGRLIYDQNAFVAFPLQIAISSTNMGNPSFRTPGSVLIAYPQLYWSPD